jgi:hypothetical protein
MNLSGRTRRARRCHGHGRASAARLRLLQPIQLDSCRPTPRRRHARPAGSRDSYAPPLRWSGGADARAGSHSSTVHRSNKLRTVAVRDGPFSMAKSHLKLVAPTEVNRTVAPNFEPVTLPPPRPTYRRASGRGQVAPCGSNATVAAELPQQPVANSGDRHLGNGPKPAVNGSLSEAHEFGVRST